MSEPGILHADLDSFFASVEQRDDPALRGRPVSVGGGVVLAASYEAKAFGVRTPMPLRTARRLCPQLVDVPPRFEAYTQASRDVFAIFEDTTPLVEGVSIDEAFLDVRGLLKVSGRPSAIATRLRERVRDEVGLAITVGVARTKFLAKVASASAKPDGLLVVPLGGELDFLHPLPVQRLWGVGPRTTERLNARGIVTVADLAGLESAALGSLVGGAVGRHLFALAHNQDPRPVVVGRRRRSIGSQCALGRRRVADSELDERLLTLVDRVTRRLRGAHRQCSTVVLRLRFDDFGRATRSHSLLRPTADTAPILAALRHLLAEARPLIRDRGITLIGISLANLDDDDAVQLELPFRQENRPELDRTVDGLRDRFGTVAVTRGVLLNRRPGVEAPRLPD